MIFPGKTSYASATTYANFFHYFYLFHSFSNFQDIHTVNLFLTSMEVTTTESYLFDNLVSDIQYAFEIYGMSFSK